MWGGRAGHISGWSVGSLPTSWPVSRILQECCKGLLAAQGFARCHHTGGVSFANCPPNDWGLYRVVWESRAGHFSGWSVGFLRTPWPVSRICGNWVMSLPPLTQEMVGTGFTPLIPLITPLDLFGESLVPWGHAWLVSKKRGHRGMQWGGAPPFPRGSLRKYFENILFVSATGKNVSVCCDHCRKKILLPAAPRQIFLCVPRKPRHWFMCVPRPPWKPFKSVPRPPRQSSF